MVLKQQHRAAPVVQCVFAGVSSAIFVSSGKLYGPLPHSIPTCSVHGSHSSSSVQPGDTVPSTPNPRVNSATGGAEILNQTPARVTSIATPGSLDTLESLMLSQGFQGLWSRLCVLWKCSGGLCKSSNNVLPIKGNKFHGEQKMTLHKQNKLLWT